MNTTKKNIKKIHICYGDLPLNYFLIDIQQGANETTKLQRIKLQQEGKANHLKHSIELPSTYQEIIWRELALCYFTNCRGDFQWF